eukprot:8165952-Prorocentrum_lima.AAC.1
MFRLVLRRGGVTSSWDWVSGCSGAARPGCRSCPRCRRVTIRVVMRGELASCMGGERPGDPRGQ